MYQDRNCRAGKVSSPCLRIFAFAAPLMWKAFPPGGHVVYPYLLQVSTSAFLLSKMFFLWPFFLPKISLHSHCWSC